MDAVDRNHRSWTEVRSAWRQPDNEGRTWLGAALLRQALGVRPGILAGIDPPVGDDLTPSRPVRKASMHV